MSLTLQALHQQERKFIQLLESLGVQEKKAGAEGVWSPGMKKKPASCALSIELRPGCQTNPVQNKAVAWILIFCSLTFTKYQIKSCTNGSWICFIPCKSHTLSLQRYNDFHKVTKDVLKVEKL